MPLFCDICTFSNCLTRYNNLKKCIDLNALSTAAYNYPEIKKLLHLDCQECCDDFFVFYFTDGEKNVHLKGYYDKGFMIKDPQGKGHYVSVKSQKDSRGDLFAINVVCRDCNDDPQEMDEKAWEFVQSCSNNFCIFDKCENKRGKGSLCPFHLSGLAKKGFNELVSFYKGKNFIIEENKEIGETKAVYLKGDRIICTPNDKEKDGLIFVFKKSSPCQNIIKRGSRQGQACGKPSLENENYCRCCIKRKK